MNSLSKVEDNTQAPEAGEDGTSTATAVSESQTKAGEEGTPHSSATEHNQQEDDEKHGGISASSPTADESENHVEDQADEEAEEDDSNDSILSVSFNQDGGCLAVGTRRGFRICNVSPFQETFRRTFATSGGITSGSNGGIATVEMLFRCNLLALVGGGPSPKYPPNKIIMWDDYRAKPIGELSFRQRVLSVKLRRDRIAVALTNRVYVYNFSDLTLLDQIPTCTNPRGLLCMSSDAGAALGVVVACPGMTRGHVRVELYHLRKTVQVEAHETHLAQIGLSMDGSLLATASEKGTLIRLFDTRRGGAPLRELRRGVERASISCIAISRACDYIGVTSDRGTVHIFHLPRNATTNTNSTSSLNPQQLPPPPTPQNSTRDILTASPPQKQSSLSSLATWTKFTRSLALGDGDPSFAQVRSLEDAILCAFLPDHPHRIAVVSLDGSLLISDFSAGGDAERVSYHHFFKAANATTSWKGSSSKEDAERLTSYTCGGDAACGAGTSAAASADVYTSDDADDEDGAVHQGIIFGEDEQEDGFVAVDQQGKKERR
jgi:WD40 repeat protein